MRSLLYLGAGDDASFLQIKGYSKYILIDGMPQHKHYEEGTYGYQMQSNFIQCLVDKFGEYELIDEDLLYFSDYNIYYYINTLCNEYDKFEDNIDYDCDILLKGFAPHEEFFQDFGFDVIYLSDDTAEPDYYLNYRPISLESTD